MISFRLDSLLAILYFLFIIFYSSLSIHYIFLSLRAVLFTFIGKFAKLVLSRACTGFDGDDAALEAIRKKSR